MPVIMRGVIAFYTGFCRRDLGFIHTSQRNMIAATIRSVDVETPMFVDKRCEQEAEAPSNYSRWSTRRPFTRGVWLAITCSDYSEEKAKNRRKKRRKGEED